MTEERSQLQWGVFSGGGMLFEDEVLYFDEEDEGCC
jgi:hypothetical protein